MKKTKRKRGKPTGGKVFAMISVRTETRKRIHAIAKADGRSPNEVLARLAAVVERVGLDAVLALGADPC